MNWIILRNQVIHYVFDMKFVEIYDSANWLVTNADGKLLFNQLNASFWIERF